MPIFIALGRITPAGWKKLDQLAGRHDEAVRRAERLGGRVVASYATMGRYDFVVTLDCPDLETAMTILNREASGGNIQYETMSGIPTREFAELFLPEEARKEERTVLRLKRVGKPTGKPTGKGVRKVAAKRRVARKRSPRRRTT